MIHPYQLHSLGKLYHEEALKEARRRHIVERARAHRGPRQSGRLGLVWRNPLALLRGAQS
jgi:hypothetical protein